MNPLHFQMWHSRRVTEEFQRPINRQAEFILFLACGDMFVRVSIYIRVHTQCYLRLLARTPGDTIYGARLRHGFDVKHEDPGSQSIFDLCFCLTHAGKDHLLWRNARLQSFVKFTTGYHVSAGAFIRQSLAHSQTRVALQREADQMLHAMQSAVQFPIVIHHRPVAI